MTLWSGWNRSDPMASPAIEELFRLASGPVSRVVESESDRATPCKAHRAAPPSNGPFDVRCPDCMREVWRFIACLHHEALWSLVHTLNGMAMAGRDYEAIIDRLKVRIAEQDAAASEKGTQTIRRLAVERDAWRRRALAAEAMARPTEKSDESAPVMSAAEQAIAGCEGGSVIYPIRPRCPVCGAPLASEAEKAEWRALDSGVVDVDNWRPELCWSSISGDHGGREPIDWRARALAAESR